MTIYKLKASDMLANIKQDSKKLVPTKAKSMRYKVGNGKAFSYDLASNLEILHGVEAAVEFSGVSLAEVKKDKAKFVPLPLKGYEATAKPEKPAKAKPSVNLKKIIAKAKKIVKGKTPKTKTAKVKTAPAVKPKPKVKKGITADIDKALESGKFNLREAADHIAAKYPDKELTSVYQVCANRVRARKLMGLPELHWKPSLSGGGFMLYIDELFAKGGKTINEMVQAVIEKFPKDGTGKPRDAKRLSGTVRNRATFLRAKKKPVLFNRTEKRYEAEYIAPGILDNPLLAVKAPAKKKPAKRKAGGRKK